MASSKALERAGAVLAGAGHVQAAADGDPAGAADGERDFADGRDVADGQPPESSHPRELWTRRSGGPPPGDLAI
jgi:hypothetical protein